ncbi:MAG TPA: AAA family ATPase, partial [Gammaproteobacteria bacterium]|nr:AAA family ATPase [Gammaproteobacteria bacterium]
EPGIGKTTLARSLAQRAHADGATVLFGRCDEDIGVPYQPFVEALGGYISAATEEALRIIDQRSLSELSRLLPEVISTVPGVVEPQATDADAERYLFFGAVASMLTDMAAAAAVVLVLDDLHWADKSTVLLLRHLVGTLGPAQVLIVCTYRESDISAVHPLSEGLSALRREPSVERVAVEGLDDGGVYALVEAMAGHELPSDGAELAQAVRRETGGNPFFAAEVLRHLAETGAVVQQEGRWVAGADLFTIGLPESVREVVGQRVRRLGEDVHRLLTVASVIGRDVDLSLLARVAGVDDDVALAALESAVERLIVTEVEDRPGRFTFTHALFQRTLYDELSGSRRARLHRQIAEMLEAECGDEPGDRIVELAHHWIAAMRPAEGGKAVRYARRAGEHALATLAPHEAIRWFRQSLELVDSEAVVDPFLRLDCLIGLGDAQRQAGDPSYRETLLDAAATAVGLGATDRLVAAALANQRGMVSSVGAVDGERIAMLEAALDAIGNDDTPERARLLATLAAELPFNGDHERVCAIATDAEAVARRLGDDATLVAVLNLTALPLWVPDNFTRSVAASQEALTLADRLGDPVAAFWAAMNRVYAMASSVDRPAAEAALDKASALAERIGQPYLIWQARYVRSLLVLLSGDADEAERIAAEALDVAISSGQPDAMVVFGANLLGV